MSQITNPNEVPGFEQLPEYIQGEIINSYEHTKKQLELPNGIRLGNRSQYSVGMVERIVSAYLNNPTADSNEFFIEPWTILVYNENDELVNANFYDEYNELVSDILHVWEPVSNDEQGVNYTVFDFTVIEPGFYDKV